MISAVSGTAGIGKTALAVYWAHQVAGRFPDGQLYVNLRGFDPARAPLDPGEVLRSFLDALGVPTQRIPGGLDAQLGLYRSVLSGKRVLVLLDNARDADRVRLLLPGSPGCMTVVTSRIQLTPLVATEGARPLTLGLLTPEESSDLLGRRLDADRVAAEQAGVEEIIARCAGLPLALAIVAARAETDTVVPLSVLAGQLRDSAGALDTLTAGDESTDLRAVFSWSIRALSPEAAELYRLLGLHPGPDLAAAAAASLIGRPVERIRPWLGELVRAHVLTEHVLGRFTFHDLLRAYAAEQARTQCTDHDQHAAMHRMLDHYLHSAQEAARLLYGPWDHLPLTGTQPGVIPERFTDEARATAWLHAEYQVVLGSIEHAASTGFDRHAWQLARTMASYFEPNFTVPSACFVPLATIPTAPRSTSASVTCPTAKAQTRKPSAKASKPSSCFARQDIMPEKPSRSTTSDGPRPNRATTARLSCFAARPFTCTNKLLTAKVKPVPGTVSAISTTAALTTLRPSPAIPKPQTSTDRSAIATTRPGR